MTSSTEYYYGRRVYHTDKNHPYNGNNGRKMFIIRKCKKGFLCSLDNGEQAIFKQSEIEPYYP